LAVLSISIITLQVVAVTGVQPLQPANVEPASAVAASVTVVPTAYGSEQSTPQLMPTGLLVTVPVPVPSLVTVSVFGDGGGGGGGPPLPVRV
jgi:hypothetical protein